MSNTKTISVLSAAIILISAFFISVITIGLMATVSKVFGMLFLAGGLLFIAYLLEMALPEELFMRMMLFASGIGFAVTSMMTALFPQVVIQAMMFGLIALSMIQIMLERSSSPDS